MIQWRTVWYYLSQLALVLFSLVELLLASNSEFPDSLIALFIGLLLAFVAYLKYRRRRHRYETDFESEY